MKLRKITTLGLALTLCAGLAAPVSATGYAGGPWLPPNYNPNKYVPSGSGGSSSSSGSSSRDTDGRYYPGGTSANTGTTTITDNQTPLANTPSTELKNNNGAKALTAAQVVKNANGIIALVNVSKISPSLFRGVTGVIHADVKIGNAIVARVYLDAAKIAALSSEIDVSMSVDAADTTAVKNKFQKHYSGNFAVVSMAQKTDFGTTIQVAIHASQLKGVDLNNVKALIYNKATNKFSKVDPSAIKIQNNYVYANIAKGGELVFTDSTQL